MGQSVDIIKFVKYDISIGKGHDRDHYTPSTLADLIVMLCNLRLFISCGDYMDYAWSRKSTPYLNLWIHWGHLHVLHWSC